MSLFRRALDRVCAFMPRKVYGAALLLALFASAPVHAATGAAAANDPSGMAGRVQACTACHGAEGRATNQGYFPRIAGKPETYLFHQLVNFRDGRRRYAPMAHLLEHLTDDYLMEMARYFSSQDLPYPPAQTSHAAQATLERGAALVRQGDPSRGIPACVQCHGDRMTGVSPAVPGLLGLPRDYLNAQLGAWKNGQRRAIAPDCMAKVASQLGADDVNAISTWLSSQVVADAHPAAELPKPLPIACGGVALPGASR